MIQDPAPEIFKRHLLEAGILDEEGIHHKLSSGRHGRKLHFDRISLDSELFDEWVEVTSLEINRQYTKKSFGKLAVLSVANGTNELVPRVADRLGAGVLSLLTERPDGKDLRLSLSAEDWMKAVAINPLVVLDDVGTTGGNAAEVVKLAQQTGFARAEVLYTWQRSPSLEELDRVGISYDRIIYEPMLIFSPEECAIQGLCARGWKLI